MKQPINAVKVICRAWHQEMRKTLAAGDLHKASYAFNKLRYWRAQRFNQGETA